MKATALIVRSMTEPQQNLEMARNIIKKRAPSLSKKGQMSEKLAAAIADGIAIGRTIQLRMVSDYVQSELKLYEGMTAKILAESK